MPQLLRRAAYPLLILVITCSSVFVLPFLMPPPAIAGVSAANAAGFNNKVAALAAALVSLFVFIKELKWPSQTADSLELKRGAIAWPVVSAVTIVYGTMMTVLSRLIILSHARYLSDAGYFIEQMSSFVNYGHRLYEQIEFPYGPLLFYGPAILQRLLLPFHLSLTSAYYSTLVLEQVAGLWMVAYILNHLPLTSRCKTLLFLFCVPVAIELSFGLNYTFFRFAASAACLVLVSECQGALKAASYLFAGQIISLAISPEMGFAFAVAGTAYAVVLSFSQGTRWLGAALSPPAATLFFMLMAGDGYLRMLRLFAHGLFNLVVEPLPHILIFLFASVWAVPRTLASFFRQGRSEAALLAALYLYVLALLPVAFGRADPGHVLFNGYVIFFLSAASTSKWKLRAQSAWIACIAATFLWAAYIDACPFQHPLRGVIHYDLLHFAPDRANRTLLQILRTMSPSSATHFATAVYDEAQPFDMKAMQSVVRGAHVATPLPIPLTVEDSLRNSGQYTPSFYGFHTAVLDASAEERAISELNKSAWALIPERLTVEVSETPANTAPYLGFALPYPLKREPFVAGKCFERNLKANWRSTSKADGLVIYKRVDFPHEETCSGF